MECTVIKGNYLENDERYIFQIVSSPCTLMEDPKSNVPFDVGKRTFIKLFAFAFILAFYAVSLLEFRPALISFRV